MDATIALLRELAPLAREYGWPAVWAVALLPSIVKIARAHAQLIQTLRKCLPRAIRNQVEQTRVLAALTQALQDRSKPAERKSPLAELVPH